MWAQSCWMRQQAISGGNTSGKCHSQCLCQGSPSRASQETWSVTFHVVIPMHSLTHMGFPMLNTDTASLSLTLMHFFLSYIFHPFSQHTPFLVAPSYSSLRHFIHPLFLSFHLLHCDIMCQLHHCVHLLLSWPKLCLFLPCPEKLFPFWNIPTATR